jgi:cytoskeletal protein RodZ
MVDDQTASHIAKHLKESKKKKKNHWFRNSRISVLVVVVFLL